LIRQPTYYLRGLNSILINKKYSIYWINFAATIAAVIVVLLILSSNLDARKENLMKLPVEQRIKLNDLGKIRSALEDNPDDPGLTVQMANNLFDLGKYSAAIPYYKQAIKLDPQKIEVQIDLGVCYFNLQLVDSALATMKTAMIKNPEHLQGLFNLGVIYYNTGNMDQARVYWRRLIDVHTTSNEAQMAQRLLDNMN